jgi:hypothetical protein
MSARMPLPAPISSHRLLACTSGALRPDPFQEHAGGFVIRVLRHEFAPECLGKDSSIEMVDELAGAGGLGGETINPVEGFLVRLRGTGRRRSFGPAHCDS